MGVFRYENKYAAPTREQRECYMKGEREEHHFGPDGQIVLILWPEAAYRWKINNEIYQNKKFEA
jgi:hypothetical protein